MPKWMAEEDVRKYLLARSVRRGTCLIVRGYGVHRGIYQKAPGRAWSHIASYAAFGEVEYDPTLDVAHSCLPP